MNSNSNYSYICPKCQKTFSQQDYSNHYKHCQGFGTTITTSPQINIPTTSNFPNYTNHIPHTTTYTTNQINNINNIPTAIPKRQIYNIPSTIQNTQIYNIPSTIPNTQTYNIPSIPTTTTINTSTHSYRPRTAIYNNPNLNQIYPSYGNNINQQYINNNINRVNVKQPVFVCNFCGKRIPLNNKNDHLLCHKIEQEDKDLLQAKKIQDEDIFNNLSPEEVEQQLKIEQYIKQQNQRNITHNNNLNNNNIFPSNNNNFITNDFNLDPDFGNINEIGNFGNIITTTTSNNNNNNMGGVPNVIIRRFTSNGNSPNFGGNMGNPEFFSNFFNQGFNGNNPQGMRRIMIPISFMGNGGDQNDLNEMIERMLHYSRENPTDQTIVSELPETKIDDIKKLDKDKQNCVICMEDFKNGDVTTNLPCLHMFHTNCIQSWLKTQNTCPICKFKLTAENINNINRRG